MKLSTKDAEHFFKLMWSVQFYVNQHLDIIPDIDSAETYGQLRGAEKMEVRDALYDNIDLLEPFTAENPANLSPHELEIVGGWKRFISGDFYILKFLKRYTIFVAVGETPQVYGVLGLYDSFEDILGGRPLPVLGKTVLLPFKGDIVFDGLISGYSVSFGRGITSELNEIYQRAKQNDRIIDTLDPEVAAARQRKRKKSAPDWRSILDELVQTTEKLRQGETVPQTKAYGLLKASAKLAQAAAHNPDDLEELFELAKRTDRALNQFWTALDRAE